MRSSNYGLIVLQDMVIFSLLTVNMTQLSIYEGVQKRHMARSWPPYQAALQYCGVVEVGRGKEEDHIDLFIIHRMSSLNTKRKV